MLCISSSNVQAAGIDQHQVIVCSAGYEVQTLFNQSLSQTLRILHDILGISLERRLQRFTQSHSFRSNNVHQRTALNTREHSFVDSLSPGFLTQNHTAARTAKRFVCSSRNKMSMRYRAWMKTRSN
ncbi:hypothetical protein D3C71_549160 [compost metagenome]